MMRFSYVIVGSEARKQSQINGMFVIQKESKKVF